MKNILPLTLGRLGQAFLVKFDFCTIRLNQFCWWCENFWVIDLERIWWLNFEWFLHDRSQIIPSWKHLWILSRTIYQTFYCLVNIIFYCTRCYPSLKILTTSWKLSASTRTLRLIAYCTSTNPLISHCGQWLMDRTRLGINTAEWNWHLHTSIDSFRSWLNLF